MRAARQGLGRSTTAVPEMVLSPGDLSGLDMGQAVASYRVPDVQLSDLSPAAEPVTPKAVPCHNRDLLDLTQPMNTVVAASKNIS